jgi:hypothetical protein
MPVAEEDAPLMEHLQGRHGGRGELTGGVRVLGGLSPAGMVSLGT